MSLRLSELLHLRVVHEDGTPLGRVFDCRCRGGPGGRRTQHGTEVVSLVYGMPGWLERLGLRSARQCEVAWHDVVRIEGDRVIVRTRR